MYPLSAMETDPDLIDRVSKCVLALEGLLVVALEGLLVTVLEGEGLVYVKRERAEVENRSGVQLLHSLFLSYSLLEDM